MRSFLSFLFLILGMMSVLMAQTHPQAFNYQAVCRNLSGSPIINQVVNFRIEILQGSITSFGINLGALSCFYSPSVFYSGGSGNQENNSLYGMAVMVA